jgi:phosphatidylserine decarboxylase
MSIADSVKSIFVPIHKEGFIFIAISAFLTVILGFLWQPFGWIGLVITIWICYFFRDPVRFTPQRDGLVISPADGRISHIVTAPPPMELGLGTDPMTRISVFMNVFDCHVNRAPLAGKITKIVYRPGLFLNADLDKASDDNERNSFIIDTGKHSIGVVQIAGLIARRIIAFSREGESVITGQRIGMIRFGSRVDVYLPASVVPAVAIGQTAIAGETVLADIASIEGVRPINAQ